METSSGDAVADSVSVHVVLDCNYKSTSMIGEQIILKKQEIESPHPGNIACGVGGHVKFFYMVQYGPFKKSVPPIPIIDLTLSPPDS